MKDGKVFGKINIIDLLVILVILAVVLAVGIKTVMSSIEARRAAEEQEEEVVQIEEELRDVVLEADLVYTVKVNTVEGSVAKAIVPYIEKAKKDGLPGDPVMNGAEYVKRTYITDVKLIPSEPDKIVTTEEDETYVVDGGREDFDMLFTIKTHVNDKKTNVVGSQEVRVGKSHIVKTSHFELYNGIVQTCDWSRVKEVKY